jgi:Tol biopolymer transport system component
VYARASLVYEQGGPRIDQVADLFLLGTDGRLGPRLTRTRDWEDDPTWSPDGSRIAYSRGDPACHANACASLLDASIWISNADGTAARGLTSGRSAQLVDRSPTWSPDGLRLAFTRYFCCDSSPNDGVYVIGADGHGLRRLVAEPASAVDWSPDGRTLAVADSMSPAVSLVDVETGQSSPLPVSGLRAPASDIAWSPDGEQLALATPAGLLVVPAVGGLVKRVGTMRGVTTVAWSPDGRRLAFSAVGPHAPVTVVGGRLTDVFLIGADGSGLRRLTANRGWDLAPDWRP